MAFQFQDLVAAGDIDGLKQFMSEHKPSRRDPESLEECIHFDNDYNFVLACEKGNLEMVKFLYSELHLSPFAQGGLGLHWAARNGHIDVLKYLILTLKVPADLNESSAVAAASENGHLECLQFLIACSADPHAGNGKALVEACMNGHIHVAQFLVQERKVAIHSQALFQACKQGFANVVEFLIDNGADVSADNNSALMGAVASGDLKILERLLKEGVDPNSRDGYPFVMAAVFGHVHVLEFLFQKLGHKVGQKLQTAFEWAAEAGKLECVKYVEQLACSLGLCLDLVEPLKLALKNGYVTFETVKYLIGRGALKPYPNTIFIEPHYTEKIQRLLYLQNCNVAHLTARQENRVNQTPFEDLPMYYCI